MLRFSLVLVAPEEKRELSSRAWERKTTQLVRHFLNGDIWWHLTDTWHLTNHKCTQSSLKNPRSNWAVKAQMSKSHRWSSPHKIAKRLPESVSEKQLEILITSHQSPSKLTHAHPILLLQQGPHVFFPSWYFLRVCKLEGWFRSSHFHAVSVTTRRATMETATCLIISRLNDPLKQEILGEGLRYSNNFSALHTPLQHLKNGIHPPASYLPRSRVKLPASERCIFPILGHASRQKDLAAGFTSGRWVAFPSNKIIIKWWSSLVKSAPEMNRIEWNHIGSVRFSPAQLWLNQNQITSAVVYHHSFPTKIAWGIMGHPSFSQSTVGLIPSNCFLEFPIKSPPQFMIRYKIFHRKLWRVLDLGKGIWFRVQTPQESRIPWNGKWFWG